MFKTAIATFIPILASSFLLFVPLPKPTYHSLYLSNSLSDNASISHFLYALTRRPHVAGSEANSDAATFVLSTLTSSNIHSHIAHYLVALTLPSSRSLSLTPPPPDPPVNFELRQEIYDGDPYADVADQVVPTFHAYAKSGSVTGPVVYVNYGRVEDYVTLKEMGVNVSGAVVLARCGKIFRGDIVQNADMEGAVGALVYTDRKDYGGERWFPEDKWMPPSGVQVGSVFSGVGDPTTPGWPSTEDCERLNDEEVENGGQVPLIPSLPISAQDGERILRSIGGQVAKVDWQGSKDGPIYRVGPGPGTVNLSYIGKQYIGTIQNVIGVIEGAEEPDRFVILGNHRDAWTFGAADPNSGTATLLEVAQRLGKLQEKGWKPRRTIILCSWDAEEYGLIGSTEWVEDNREMLASRAVAYLNVDTGVCGPGFYASATPQLDGLLKKATQQVQDPDNSSQTIYQSWFGSSNSAEIERLGGGESDFAAFVQHIGIPSAMLSYGSGYPVFHSMYDDFVWMQKFGDPGFHRHVAVASVWGLIALWLADETFLPFNYLSYAEELQKYVKDLEHEISGKDINLTPLFKSIEELENSATKINNQIKVYGPSKHNIYGSKSFPGIEDAIIEAKSLNSRVMEICTA
ncbi:hypothetical protein FNV43_RR16878 [Rhamnella rubrinervis]|uniref:glutamate carboxypeptidase II n=1 Tax=Rhamnella rubrinervis TaxID=2594499 RepID=A0A8K0GZM9_9ROSA|nr:hypothetical protein FNV43_RR16878 [Rhamnella rubrinervis]